MRRFNQNKRGLKQKGAALIIFVFIFSLAFTSFLLKAIDPAKLKAEQNKKTIQALSQAKQALLAYSVRQIPVSINKGIVPDTGCNRDCVRPGDLPCPDQDNDGVADLSNCSNPSDRLGRLPWKTLGLGDLRDGAGERLWYAVSNQYKNNPRVLPLNSDSLGTISFRNNTNTLINSATANTGLVAVVIAPNEVLTRQDNLAQNRLPANENNPQHYLDIAFGEDNANFDDGTNNGFISGKVLLGEQTVVNDMMLPVTRNEMNAVIEPMVLSEVAKAVLMQFCTGRNNIKTRTCRAPTVDDYLPSPASFQDDTCLGINDVTGCAIDATKSLGRIPVAGVDNKSGGTGWEKNDVNSILQGQSKNNWFQQNGWRELVLYAVAPACTKATPGCTGAGYLTLQNAIKMPINNKQLVLISAGSLLAGQKRSNDTEKISFDNYLEEENFNPLDTVFSRYQLSAIKNDRATSIP